MPCHGHNRWHYINKAKKKKKSKKIPHPLNLPDIKIFNGKKYKYSYHLKTKQALKDKKEWFKEHYPNYSLRSVKHQYGYALYVEIKRRRK